MFFHKKKSTRKWRAFSDCNLSQIKNNLLLPHDYKSDHRYADFLSKRRCRHFKILAISSITSYIG